MPNLVLGGIGSSGAALVTGGLADPAGGTGIYFAPTYFTGAYFTGAYFPGTPAASLVLGPGGLLVLLGLGRRRTAPVAPPPTFWGALWGFLKAKPSLSTLTAVYFSKTPLASIAVAPSGWDPPFLVFDPPSEKTVLDGPTAYRTLATVHATLLATDGVQAETLGRAAYMALLPKQPAVPGNAMRPPLLATDGIELIARPGAPTPARQMAPYWQGRPLWGFAFDYEFLIHRPRY